MLIAAACSVPIILQKRRLAELEGAWQGLAERHDWLFIASRGPWYQRDSCRVMIPSDYGAIELTWNPGYRGSPATTRIRSLAVAVADLSIQLRDKLDPERIFELVETGTPEFDALYLASSRDPQRLRDALDQGVCASLLEEPAEFDCCDELLTLESVGLIGDEARVMRLLASNFAFLGGLGAGRGKGMPR